MGSLERFILASLVEERERVMERSRILSLGRFFIGYWRNELPHCRGLEKNKDGSFYFGDWANGIKKGEGFEYSEEKEYFGNYVDGKHEGIATVKLPGLPQQSAHFVSGTITKLLEGRGQSFPVHQALKFEKTLLAKVVAIDRLINDCSHVAGKKYEMKGVEKDTTESEQYIEEIEKKLRSLADSIELEDMHLDLTTIWEPHTSFRPCSPLVPKDKDPGAIICNLVFLDNSQSIDKIWTWLMTENVLPYLESHDLEIQFGQVLDIYDEIGILRQNQDENKNISDSKFNINILDNDQNEQVMRNSNLQELAFNSQISNKSLNSP